MDVCNYGDEKGNGIFIIIYSLDVETARKLIAKTSNREELIKALCLLPIEVQEEQMQWLVYDGVLSAQEVVSILAIVDDRLARQQN